MMGDDQYRFTPSARRAFAIAEDEARALNHHVIGPEHLLLGIAGVPESTGGRSLTEAGVAADGVRAAITAIAGYASTPVRGTPQWHKYTERAVARAHGEARRAGKTEIDTLHLLLALLGDDVVQRILTDLGHRLSAIAERAMKAALRDEIGMVPEAAEMRIWGTIADMERLAAVARRENRVANDLIWEAVAQGLKRTESDGGAALRWATPRDVGAHAGVDPPGGEMLMRGTPSQIEQLVRLSDRLLLPLGKTIWVAVRIEWFSDIAPATG
jgi:ClpA/ClpB-like protein